MPVDAKTRRLRLFSLILMTPFVSKKQVIFQSLLRLFSKDLKKKES